MWGSSFYLTDSSGFLQRTENTGRCAGPRQLWGCNVSIKDFSHHFASTRAAVETTLCFSVAHSLKAKIAILWLYLPFKWLFISLLHCMSTFHLAIESYSVAGSVSECPNGRKARMSCKIKIHNARKFWPGNLVLRSVHRYFPCKAKTHQINSKFKVSSTQFWQWP